MSKNKMIMLPREVVEQALESLLNEGEFRKLLKPLIEKSIDSIRDALEQPDAGPPATAPEGWKLVPVVPTDDMEAAAETDYERFNGGYFPDCLSAYRAMLAATPHPPEHYDQQALDLCLTCAWKTMIPGDCCLNCARRKPQVEQEPVAEIQVKNGHWIDTPAARTAHLVDGVYKLYTRPQPKREPPQVDQEPYLYYDPENGDTWTQEAINDGCCPPDGLIALYTKETK